MAGMFKVWFKNASNDRNLTNDAVILPQVPGVGEAVYLRERPHHGPTTGRVASRHWHIATREPENSEVVVMVQLD